MLWLCVWRGTKRDDDALCNVCVVEAVDTSAARKAGVEVMRTWKPDWPTANHYEREMRKAMEVSPLESVSAGWTAV